MDPIDIIAPIAAFVGVIVVVPIALQWVNMVSQRMHASNLQTQVNDNTALNNTSVSGVAGTEEVSRTASKS